MVISYLMQDSVLDETGFGIYAISGSDFELGDTTVVLDMSKETIYEAGKDLQVDWQLFINAYQPQNVSA
jgi:uncharacterized protein (DUF1786 family)